MERCPRDVTPYEVIIYLQGLAVRNGMDYPKDLGRLSSSVKRGSRIQDTQEIIDREFEDITRDDLPLPPLVGPKDMDAFRKALSLISGEEQ